MDNKNILKTKMKKRMEVNVIILEVQYLRWNQLESNCRRGSAQICYVLSLYGTIK